MADDSKKEVVQEFDIDKDLVNSIYADIATFSELATKVPPDQLTAIANLVLAKQLKELTQVAASIFGIEEELGRIADSLDEIAQSKNDVGPLKLKL